MPLENSLWKVIILNNQNSHKMRNNFPSRIVKFLLLIDRLVFLGRNTEEL